MPKNVHVYLLFNEYRTAQHVRISKPMHACFFSWCCEAVYLGDGSKQQRLCHQADVCHWSSGAYHQPPWACFGRSGQRAQFIGWEAFQCWFGGATSDLFTHKWHSDIPHHSTLQYVHQNFEPCQAWAEREADLHRGLMMYAIRRSAKNPESRRGTLQVCVYNTCHSINMMHGNILVFFELSSCSTHLVFSFA